MQVPFCFSFSLMRDIHLLLVIECRVFCDIELVDGKDDEASSDSDTGSAACHSHGHLRVLMPLCCHCTCDESLILIDFLDS